MKSQEQRTFVPFVLTRQQCAEDRRRDVRPRRQSGGRSPTRKPRRSSTRGTTFTSFPPRQLAGDTGEAQSRVHGDRRHLRRLRRVQGAAAREGAEEHGRRRWACSRPRSPCPDFYNGELATSTILVADKVNMLTAPLSPEEARERPFVFGMQELLPAPDMEFKKSRRALDLLPGLQRRSRFGRQAEPDPRVRIPQDRGQRARSSSTRPTRRRSNAAEPAAAVRPGQVPGPRRHHGAAGVVRRRPVPPGHQDHRQGVRQDH